MRVRKERGRRPHLLLLDIVCLGSEAEEENEDEMEELGARLVLLPDAADPERVFCCQARAAHILTISWLPALANLLAEGMSQSSG